MDIKPYVLLEGRRSKYLRGKGTYTASYAYSSSYSILHLTTMTTNIDTDVLIVGGGPVGLLVAYSLARQGVDTVLVGK